MQNPKIAEWRVWRALTRYIRERINYKNARKVGVWRVPTRHVGKELAIRVRVGIIRIAHDRWFAQPVGEIATWNYSRSSWPMVRKTRKKRSWESESGEFWLAMLRKLRKESKLINENCELELAQPEKIERIKLLRSLKINDHLPTKPHV